MVMRESLIVFGSILFFCSSVYAFAGVSPAIYEIDFKPGLKQVFDFNFATNPNINMEIYSEGDLSEYIKLSTKELTGGGNVKALLELPEVIEKPGEHRILIGGKQLIEEGEGIGAAINIRGVIDVKVPYPGKYAELTFSSTNANAGDPVDFNLIIYSRGKEDINAKASIEIHDSNDKIVEVLDLGQYLIESTQSKQIKKSWDTSKFGAGRYKAVAIVEYGGEKNARIESPFRLGELFVDVISYTEEFERDKINKFDIGIESFWNDPIENVFADVLVFNEAGNISFLTPSVSLQSFGKSTLMGHFDTTLIEQNKFQAKITLNYEGKTSEKIVDLKFKSEINYIVVGILVVLILIVIFLIVFFVLRSRKNGQKKL